MIWKSHYHSQIAKIADFLTSILSFLVTYYFGKAVHILKPEIFPTPYDISKLDAIVIIFLSYTCILLFKEYRGYSYQRFTSIYSETRTVLKVVLLNTLLSIALYYMLKPSQVPRMLFVILFFTNNILFIIQKTLLFYIAAFIRKHGQDRKKIILVGTGTRATKFIETVNKNFHWGLDIIGLLTGDQERVGEFVHGIKIIDYSDNIERVLKKYNPEEVIITISTKRFDKVRNVLEVCEKEGVQVRFNSDFFGHITKHVSIDNVFGLNIISFHTVRKSEIELLIKRIIDIVGASLALMIFLPFMIIAAIGIYFSDGRPVLYNWNVIGLNKKPFVSWKFRTMIRNADAMKDQLLNKNEMSGPVFKIKDDPRILPFGKWLRKWSIDETPQLFSVLLGDMSLVGPRPAGPHELENYESWHRRKLSVKPGITCLWQASGRNKINQFDDWVKLDLEYIDNWSVFLDIKILFKTIPAVLFGKGAS